MSLARQAMDDVRRHLADAVAPAAVATSGDAPVLLSPAALARAGRSRRNGSLLDLELTVAVTVTTEDPLPLLESLLVAAETYRHVGIGPLPAGAAGLGFSIVLPVAVPLPEPEAPAVTEVVVELHPHLARTEGS